jgi:bacterioferritin (cytochrome b1)
MEYAKFNEKLEKEHSAILLHYMVYRMVENPGSTELFDEYLDA